MTKNEAIRAIDESIDRLDRLQAVETDPERIAEIGRQIQDLVFKKITAHWESLASRNQALAELTAALQSVVDRGSSSPSGAGILAEIAKIAERVSQAVGATRSVRGAGGRRARAARPLRILAVHGVGGHAEGGPWENAWRKSVEAAMAATGVGRAFTLDFVRYDDIVRRHGLSMVDVAEAIWRLGTSGVVHGISDRVRRGRGLFDLPHTLRWTAGMVAQWASQEDFRKDTRARLAAWVAEREPDVVLAHSLGSLVSYDAFLEDPALIRGRTFVSFGSQIGNPFVRGTFGGRIVPLEGAHWYHLYNPRDRAFTENIRLTHERFVQVLTNFDVPDDPMNHDSGRYITHRDAVDVAWRAVATGDHFAAVDGERAASGAGRNGARSAPFAALTACERAFASAKRPPQRRALLIGINEYPNPEDCLSGCVNDVHAMSAVLQEVGFRSRDVRIVLNDRATAAGIVERLHWLLDGVEEGQERVLYYSGHGAQIPAYGAGEDVDHIDECLVPHDFDWSLDRAVTDDQFFELYSQLAYGAHFIAVFDCCHSGGLERAGAARARGLTPPDDIRHRAMRWVADDGRWDFRDFRGSEFEDLAKAVRTDDDGKRRSEEKVEQFVGRTGVTHRLGGAAPLRRLKASEAPDARNNRPYMPVLIQACQENELAYEHRSGSQSYGAFTFSLVKELHGLSAAQRRQVTFKRLVDAASARVTKMGYVQKPEIRGPRERVNARIPW